METCALFFDISVQAAKNAASFMEGDSSVGERCLIAEVVGPNPILFLFSILE